MKLKRLITYLLEGAGEVRLYHGSSRELEIGDIIGGRVFKSNFGDVEKIMEYYRPEGMAGRLNGVYLVSRPSDVYTAGGSDEYIYLMKPIGRVDRHHGAWLGVIYDYAMDNADELTRKGPKLSKASLKAAIADPQVQSAALNYWNGKPVKVRKGEVWEYIVDRAQVIKRVK